MTTLNVMHTTAISIKAMCAAYFIDCKLLLSKEKRLHCILNIHIFIFYLSFLSFAYIFSIAKKACTHTGISLLNFPGIRVFIPCYLYHSNGQRKKCYPSRFVVRQVNFPQCIAYFISSTQCPITEWNADRQTEKEGEKNGVTPGVWRNSKIIMTISSFLFSDSHLGWMG